MQTKAVALQGPPSAGPWSRTFWRAQAVHWPSQAVHGSCSARVRRASPEVASDNLAWEVQLSPSTPKERPRPKQVRAAGHRGGGRCSIDGVGTHKTDGVSWSIEDFLWPVVVNRTLSSALTDAQLQAALAAMDSVLAAREGKFSLVHDYTGFQHFTAKQRQMVAEHGKVNRLRTAHRCVGIAFVFDSALLRGLLTAVHWLHRTPTRTKVFADAAHAKAWARSLHRGGPASVSPSDEQGESVPPPINNAS